MSNDESQKNNGEASPQPEQSRALAQGEEPSPSVPQQLQILVDLEKQRIDSYNRRTDVARYAIEMNDAADKRQFEYRMAELDAGKTSSQRRHKLAKGIAVGFGGVGSIVIALLLYMAFFGTLNQSDIAIKIAIVISIAVGGYGAIETIIRAVGKLFKEGDG